MSGQFESDFDPGRLKEEVMLIKTEQLGKV